MAMLQNTDWRCQHQKCFNSELNIQHQNPDAHWNNKGKLSKIFRNEKIPLGIKRRSLNVYQSTYIAMKAGQLALR